MAKLHRDKLSKNYSTENTLVANFLLSVLYLIGETIIDDKLRDNIKANVALKIQLRTELSTKTKVIKRRIRPILPLAVKKKYKGLDLETKRLIADPPLLDEASSVIP